MIYRTKDLGNYKLGAMDDELGKVKEFYFDDKFWTIRYLVADTGGWLTGRQVLISPYALDKIDADEKLIHVRLTKKQIEESPSLDADKPVSRQFEDDYYGYYGWRPYWHGPYAWGGFYYPAAAPPIRTDAEVNVQEEKWDPNLRSSREVTGYNIGAEDGDIGHVSDFLIDDDTWMVRYLVIDTMKWWPGKEVLIAPKWVDQISWEENKVFVKMNRDTIKQAPEYDKNKTIDRAYEDQLYRYYNREGYWAGESLREARRS